MIRSYKYRLYPSKAQSALIDDIFNVNRYLYNCALQERKAYYCKYKKTLSYNSQAAQLPAIKKHDSEMFANVYSQTLQQTLKKLDTAYSNFFRRVKNGEEPGFPRFKSAKRFKSILFPQGTLMGAAGAKILSNGNFAFFKIGEVKTIMHRPFEGRCVQVSLKRDGNQYYAIVVCELEQPQAAPNSNTKVIGIDLGLNNFITIDDGTQFHHPKPYKTAKEKLAFVQRKLALKQKGSKSRGKVVATLQKAYRKISNIRNDWQHKAANSLLQHADIICMEKLDIKEMMSAQRSSIDNVLNSNISDAAWAAFAHKLSYKAESANKKIIFVDPRNTSKTCCQCGKIKEKLDLKDRIYQCDHCGNAMDRDINAAINIKRRGTLRQSEISRSEQISL